MHSQKNPAFITLKDHKINFRTSTPCRLLNPCKSELGKISKLILANLFFSSITNKLHCAFIQLDIMEFYPSITETILDNPLSFAKQHVEISDKDLKIIKHYGKLLLY